MIIKAKQWRQMGRIKKIFMLRAMMLNKPFQLKAKPLTDWCNWCDRAVMKTVGGVCNECRRLLEADCPWA